MTASPRPAAVAVVIPARDEEARIVSCLISVLEALRDVTVPWSVTVVAHRCADRTARIAGSVLDERGAVVADWSSHVSQARARGAAEAMARLQHVPPSGIWLLSTDADSTVPPDWARKILALVTGGAAAIAGLAEIDSLHLLAPAARSAYLEVIRSGIHGATHRHAYAANLAVRADAYLSVGGWPHVRVGEEHALLSALDRAGWPVLRTTDLVVSTSGRIHARARGGLGDLLHGLVAGEDAHRQHEAESERLDLGA